MGRAARGDEDLLERHEGRLPEVTRVWSKARDRTRSPRRGCGNAAVYPGFPPDTALALVDSSAPDRYLSGARFARASGQGPVRGRSGFVRRSAGTPLDFWAGASDVFHLFRDRVSDFARFPRAIDVALAPGLVGRAARCPLFDRSAHWPRHRC